MAVLPMFRRSSSFILTIFTGAFVTEIAFDEGTKAVWNSWNKGRQWQDIRSKYIQ
ncbi:hypothetical protein HDU98_011294 [Podochytrium sp. JEL0797]|nr:hypothetical protein HDU98_011294 [Podochytrium sp. JEL0797]